MKNADFRGNFGTDNIIILQNIFLYL